MVDMDWLQTLLDNSSTPILTAFLLGLLTALSPCPLATNIAAIGFIGRDIENRKRIFRNGLLYTLGRILSYTLLGVILITILKEGSSMFGIQKTIGTWGELILGPLLLVIGLFMLWGDKLNLPKFGFTGNPEGLARKGGWGALMIGVLFALAFCPTSGVFYFGMLIPMSAHDLGRLSSTHDICCRYGYTGTCCCMGSRLQRTTNGKFLRKDTESAKMGEPYCRRGIHHHRHILLLDNVFVK